MVSIVNSITSSISTSAWVRGEVQRPGVTVAALAAFFVFELRTLSFAGVSFFPQTDAGQFTINLKAPTGSRIEVTDRYVAQVEDLIKGIVAPDDFHTIVSNIGVVNDLSSLYTTNSGPYTATIQTQLTDDHKTDSYEYMDRVQKALNAKFPELRTFFQSGSMVDAILNSGMPAPIDVQVTGRNLDVDYVLAKQLAGRIAALPEVGQIYIPQDMDYPGLELNIDRVHAMELGLSQQEIVDNVITALNSNVMIAPNYWVDRNTGNDYFLTVQYYESGRASIRDPLDLTSIPLRSPSLKTPTTLDTVVKMKKIQTPTMINHYQIQRSSDVYVTPKAEDLGHVTSEVEKILAAVPHAVIQPDGTFRIGNVRIALRGMVQGMRESFTSFGIGFSLSFILLYLILVAQFKSFIDPILIMLAIPMGVTGVLAILLFTHTTMNVMSLMGVLMLVGIANSSGIVF